MKTSGLYIWRVEFRNDVLHGNARKRIYRINESISSFTIFLSNTVLRLVPLDRSAYYMESIITDPAKAFDNVGVRVPS